eukprot:m51a1_g3151 hypothetical protein (684) ;mRNA; f:328148-330385
MSRTRRAAIGVLPPAVAAIASAAASVTAVEAPRAPVGPQFRPAPTDPAAHGMLGRDRFKYQGFPGTSGFGAPSLLDGPASVYASGEGKPPSSAGSQQLGLSQGADAGGTPPDSPPHEKRKAMAALAAAHEASGSEWVAESSAQTLYRDGEAQTDPFSPEYVVRQAGTPEVVHLARAGFGWGRGLPAREEDLDAIVWARERRASIRRLQVEKRLRDMDVARREGAIDEAAARRLDELRARLEEDDLAARMRAERRVERLSEAAAAKREKMLEDARAKRLRAQRKLEAERKSAVDPGRTRKRDVIGEHGDYGSAVYAPLDRQGALGNKEAAELLTTLEKPSLDALRELEAPGVRPMFKSSSDMVSATSRREAERKRQRDEELGATLTRQSRGLAMADRGGLGGSVPGLAGPGQSPTRLPPRTPLGEFELTCAQKIEKPPPRPPTPSVEPLNEVEELKNAAALMLQKLIRGRAAQNAMYEGLQRRGELITELTRPVEELTVTDLDSETRSEADERTMSLREGSRTAAVAQVCGEALDFLAKELTRQRDHTRLLQLAESALRERESREAAERRKRMFEEEATRECDAHFRRVTEAGYAVADYFLQSVFSDAVETTATRQALDIAREHVGQPRDVPAEQIPEAVYSLLEQFLWPTVEKELRAKLGSEDEEKFDVAAVEALDYVEVFSH